MKNKKNIIMMIFITTILFITCMYSDYQYYSLQQKLTTTQENLQTETAKTKELNVTLNDVKKELETAKTTIADLKNSEYKLVYMGNFKITHYCTGNYKHICGSGDGITATGTKVTPGTTIAVDPSVIPYGSQVYIDGYGWRSALDCGGAVKGNHIDVAVSTHDEAMSLGTRNKGVWLLIKNS